MERQGAAVKAYWERVEREKLEQKNKARNENDKK